MTNEQLAVAALVGSFAAGIVATVTGVVVGIKLERTATKDSTNAIIKKLLDDLAEIEKLKVKKNTQH